MKKAFSCLLAAALCLMLFGCGKKGADETKPIDQIKAEVAKMDVAKIRSTALSYKDTIVAKQADVAKVADQLKSIKPTELLGEKAAELKAQLSKIENSISALKERFQIYYEKLREKGGDLTGLELK
jgi:uncharacterized lipoprotein YehR (DUF1307 family)